MTGKKERVKKDSYQKALSAYSQVMKVFHKGDYKKADGMLEEFLGQDTSEKELVDRAKVYLAICKAQLEKEKIQLKTFDDYYQFSVYKINQGEYKDALKLLEKAREMKPKEGKVLYLMADAYFLMSRKDQCLDQLKKAIQMDKYFSILAQNDVDFENLREDKKFKLITRMA